MNLCFFLNNDRTLVVGPTVLAYSMWHNRLATSGAFSERRSNHLPVCSSFISSGLGCFIFWAYRHFRTPPCLLVYAICQTDLIIILTGIWFVNSFIRCFFISENGWLTFFVVLIGQWIIPLGIRPVTYFCGDFGRWIVSPEKQTAT